MNIGSNIKKIIHKYGLLGSIAKNAISQFKKWKAKQPNLTEAEISQNIFDFRYSNGNFSKTERIKINKYYESDFKCQSLLDFCLISLDVEGNINPLDNKVFNETAKYLEIILDDYGYPKEDETTGTFLDKLNVSSSKICSFYNQWFKKIMGRKFTL